MCNGAGIIKIGEFKKIKIWKCNSHSPWHQWSYVLFLGHRFVH